MSNTSTNLKSPLTTQNQAIKASNKTKRYTLNSRLTEIPLYERISLTQDKYNELHKFEYFSGPLDCYCINCGTFSVFRNDKSQKDIPNLVLYSLRQRYDYGHMFSIRLFCSRNPSHSVSFHFEYIKDNLVKSGQYPSLADLHISSLSRYRKVMPTDIGFDELVRATGLAAHGVGIGSYVYLRRIFEHLISDAYVSAVKSKKLSKASQSKFEKSRMNEKISILSAWLPTALSKNSSLYSILSKGIHELTEEECLEYFPILQSGIELILEQKLATYQLEQKEAAITSAINDINSNLSKSPSSKAKQDVK